ncbi:MAG TPA: iron ABC transporter permease [Anaerolineae bacterium]|nr:iron ABC transporter permease [Anaerolineae bacterium]
MDRAVDRDGASVRGESKGQEAGGRRRSPVLLLLVLLPLAFLLLFYFYPLISIVGLSLAPEGRLDLTALARLVRSAYYIRILWFTTWQAALSTFLTVIVGLPGAYVFARYTFPGKSVLEALITVPFVLPTVVVAVAFTALIGPRGLINTVFMRALGLDRPPLDLQGTLAVILLAHVFYNAVLVVRMVGTQWANLDPTVVEAARVLGAGRWRAFWEVTLPLLAPSLSAAALLTFLFCFTSFGVVLILGGGRYATLEVEIYYRTVYLPNLPLAATLALIQILLTFGLMSAYTRIQTRISTPRSLRPRQITQRPLRAARERTLLVGALLPLLTLLLAPPAALIERSLTLGGVSFLAHYRALFTNPRRSVFYVPPIAAVRNSLVYALATVGLSVVLGSMVAVALNGRDRRRLPLARMLDPLFMLPLGTSAVTLGLGYIVALDEPPLNLRTSPVLVVLAHTLVALPFVVRSVLPALRSIDPRLREAAAVLGASPWRVFREIDLPITARAMGVGAIFAFTVSMGEFGATSLVARPQYPTMPIAIYRLLGQPGISNYGQALAMSTLLMLVCALGFLLIERFRVGEVGEF